MNTRYILVLVCGMILAGIVHISIILLIPNYSSRDAWNIVSTAGDKWAFRKLTNDDSAAGGLEDTDPYFQMGACTFNLKEAGLRLTGGKSSYFWSLSVFDQGGAVIYSLNNQSAIDDRLDLVVMSPFQMIALRDNPPEIIDRSVVIEADIENGFVVLRQFQGNSPGKSTVDDFLASARCEKFEN
jgi:uncharacterized membrane protein